MVSHGKSAYNYIIHLYDYNIVEAFNDFFIDIIMANGLELLLILFLNVAVIKKKIFILIIFNTSAA